MIDYIIPVHKPYDFNMAIAYLERHAAYGIEKIENGHYYRFIPCGDLYGTVRVAVFDHGNLCVSVSECVNNGEILNKIEQLFDTSHKPSSLPIISGVRVIGCFNPYETAVSIILGQLISIQQATKKLGKLVRMFGRRIDDGIYAFPSPSSLISKDIEKIGITKIKAAAIRSLSEQISSKKFRFSYDISLDEIEKQLLSIKGIGPWTAQLIMMRCFSYKDAFPRNDLFVHKAITQDGVDESLWHSNRAYLTHYIWGRVMQLPQKRRPNGIILSKN